MSVIDREKLRTGHERVVARLDADPAFGLMRPNGQPIRDTIPEYAS